MFLCAREAPARPQESSRPDEAIAETSIQASTNPQPQQRRGSSATPHPAPFFRRIDRPLDREGAAYLQLLDALQHVIAQLLGVHALSTALRFAPGEAIAVDAAEWWKELQRQSVALVRRRQAAVASACSDAGRQNTAEAATRSFWSLTSRPQEQTRSQREIRSRTSSHRTVLASSDAFAELPASEAAAFFTQALQLVLNALDRVQRRQRRQEQHEIDVFPDPETVTQILASVDDGITFAAAELLQRWTRIPQAGVNPTTAASSASPEKMSVAVVNALLQTRDVGVRHTFHEHLLLPSLARRTFPKTKRWLCSVCDRVTPVAGGDGTPNPCVYRCAACDFNLCRECFTRIPNASGPSSTLSSSEELSGLLGTERFFTLAMARLQQPTDAVIVRQLAVEMRRRVLELYPHDFRAAAGFARLFHELLSSGSNAAIALVQSTSPHVPSIEGPTAAWFPPFTRTWTMSLNTLLGPFLRASTMLKDTHELDTAVRAAKQSNAMVESLRGQWTSGYAELRETLGGLMRSLLADEQHPLVMDATLCWLALTLLTADQRRRMNYDVHERLDGFLVNVSSMLLGHILPVLDEAQYDSTRIEARYHQSVEPVRVYASKDFPEVPLHYARGSSEDNESLVNAEIEEIRARDARSIADYDVRRQRRTAETRTKTQEEVPTAYYPHLSCHEGVVCDRCEYPNFHDVRYKCAFCADMDLCSACFEDFRVQQASAAAGKPSSDGEPVAHNLDHVFLRIEAPIPVFAVKHFKPLPVEWLSTCKAKLDTDEDDAPETKALCCADCGDAVGATGRPDEVVYQCANCFSPRSVCAACLTREEKLSNGDPHRMHAPGHVYFVVTDPWRRQLPVQSGDVARKLHLRRLLHPPALIPRLRFARDTEVFYMTLKCLHFGPLSTLSRWLSVTKEIQELQAFCVCDEERCALETQRRQQQGRRRQDGSRRRSLKRSAHYKASKTRLEDLRVKSVRIELHLLASANIAAWLVFYARTCRWLLLSAAAEPASPSSSSGSSSQDPFSEPLTAFSTAFSGFPEHFFFDLCDVVYLLGLEKLGYPDLVAELRGMKQDEGDDEEAVDEVTEVVEPLLVMLTQMVVASKFTKNPHLRVEALRSLTTLLTFVSKGQQLQHRTGHRRVDALFQRHGLLARWLVPGVLQFHSDMDRYNASNNGLAFTSAVSSGDHVLWGFLPTRLSVTILLRFLWQLPSQRTSLLHMLSTATAVSPPLSSNDGAQQLTGLVSGLWSDVAKLFDEAHSKITTLRQMHELIEASLDGNVVVLPFRRDMLDGYLAIHAKQLRLTLRLLLEALELISWLAAMASGESSFRSRSLAAPAAALRHVLVQPLVVEQAARTLSFLVASLANAHEEKDWAFSQPLVEDGRLLLAHLIMLVVRYAGRNTGKSSARSSTASNSCSPSSFWKLVRASGDVMERRIGDLDTHVRWGLNTLCTRIESESYLGSTSLDDDSESEDALCLAERAAKAEGRELDEDEALALLEKQAVSTSSSSDEAAIARRRLGKRFIATLAKDGRFDFRLFVGGCRFLRPSRANDSEAEEPEDLSVEDGYLYLDDSWVQQFVRTMQEADEMIHVQEAMEACLGDVPDQYLDPLLSTLMVDPVRLPSGNILDRSVIERHLLAAAQQGGSSGRDPFTREPLSMDMVEPCDALRTEIQLYLRTKMRHFRKTAREDVLATWGLGWDVLFDSSSETEEADSEDGGEGSGAARATDASS